MADITHVKRFLDSLTMVPSDLKEYTLWIEGSEDVPFLCDTIGGAVPVYISGPRMFLYSVFVPSKRLNRGYRRDLTRWNFGPSEGWGYSYRPVRMGHREDIGEIKLSPPLEHTGTRTLEAAEPLLFLRDFAGYEGEKLYLEINQRFSHVVGLHRAEDSDGLVKLNGHGDLLEVFTATQYNDSRVCTIDADALNLYMLVSGQALVRLFEIQRVRDWPTQIVGQAHWVSYNESGQEVYAKRVRQRGLATYLRGAQVVRPLEGNEELVRLVLGERGEARKYETFLIEDIKHDEVREWPCDPEQLGNYFVESDLPNEISPVYFRPDVLLKYKSDPDRYTVGGSSISCRGTWHLQTYGLTDDGQVYTYVKYLGHLPYAEQVYWKSFNQKPTKGLPARVIARDFRGEWVDVDDPLDDLLHLLADFPQSQYQGKPVQIWSLGSIVATRKQFERLHYVVTTSSKEWNDEILQLAKVVVEGLQLQPIKRLAQSLGCHDERLGTIKLLEACLTAKSIDADVVSEICEPLRSLWQVRSQSSAHLSEISPKKGRQLKKDYRKRVHDLLAAMQQLAGLVRKGVLDVASTTAS